jgi:hypothetical protein
MKTCLVAGDSNVIRKIGIDELIPKMKDGSAEIARGASEATNATDAFRDKMTVDCFRTIAMPKAAAIAGL